MHFGEEYIVLSEAERTTLGLPEFMKQWPADNLRGLHDLAKAVCEREATECQTDDAGSSLTGRKTAEWTGLITRTVEIALDIQDTGQPVTDEAMRRVRPFSQEEDSAYAVLPRFTMHNT